MRAGARSSPSPTSSATPPRYKTYENLAATRTELPSGATIRKRLGRLTDIALELAMRQVAARRRPPAR
jgi:hypothetical protein